MAALRTVLKVPHNICTQAMLLCNDYVLCSLWEMVTVTGVQMAMTCEQQHKENLYHYWGRGWQLALMSDLCAPRLSTQIKSISNWNLCLNGLLWPSWFLGTSWCEKALMFEAQILWQGITICCIIYWLRFNILTNDIFSSRIPSGNDPVSF